MKYSKILKSLSFLLFISFSTNAQEQELTSSSDKRMLPLRVSYYGENGVHPGLRVGTSYLLHEKTKVKIYKRQAKQSKKGSKTKYIQYKLDANLGYYNHPNNHTGVLLGLGVTRHKNKNKKKVSFAWSFEVNYLRRFYNIETFEILEDGSINTINLAGNGGLMFALAPSIERRFGEKGTLLFLKPAFQAVKYNHSNFLNAAVELGVSLNLSK